MRISRVHLHADLQTGSSVEAPSETAHYLLTVLRLQDGDPVQVFNGRDGEFSATLNHTGRNTCRLLLTETLECRANPGLIVHLGMGLCKGERMDLAIQKATELGVGSVTALFTDRSQIKLSGSRLSRKLEHWQKVAISASEQCGRTCIPVVNAPQSLPEWLEAMPGGLIFSADTTELTSELVKGQVYGADQEENLNILTGPEGGFSGPEIALAKARDYAPVSLGGRILRAETAPLAALTLIHYLWRATPS